MPFPPAVMLTLLLASLLLIAFYTVAPAGSRLPLLMVGGLMVITIAFTSVELTLYLLIMSTLLSPEIVISGGVTGSGTTATRGVTLRLDDMLLTIICLTWLFRMAYFKELGSIRRTPLNQPIALYWLVVAFTTLAGFYVGRVGNYGFFFVLKYLEYFVLFYMVANQIHSTAEIRRYLIMLLVTCAIASLLGIAQIPSGERVSAPFEGEQGEPNTFGGYLVLMFSIVLGMFLQYRVKTARFWLAGLLGLILVPLMFTESRSSYLALIVAYLMFLLFARDRKLLIGMTLVGISLIPFVLPENVAQRISYTFSQHREAGQISMAGLRIDTSTSERLRSWQNVLEKYFPQHPLLGVGVTGGPFLDAQYPRVLLESGMVGLILFIWLLRRIWMIFRQCYDELADPLLKGAALGALCGYAGLLVHAIGANTFIIVRIMEPLMIVLGLLMAALLHQRDDAEETELAMRQQAVSI